MSVPSAYKVFARVYRPQSFSEVLGQDVAVQIFQNALQNNTLSHAILLTGIRGVGKTTSARLLAKTLCCTAPVHNIDPCNQCNSCVAFNAHKHTDIVEMDAASHTGVDDVREIIEGVSYAPAFGRYRVYIVDEVHMLSKSAFNAFLKTLEEPPEHAKFIFATTEIEKVPETILSRCLQIQLKPMGQDVIEQHLDQVCQKEQLQTSENALSLIAIAAQGSMRDALSILEKVASYVRASGDAITPALVERVLGRPPQEELLSLCDAIVAGKPSQALEIVRGCFAHNVDPVNIAKSLLTVLHQSLCKTVGMTADIPKAFEGVGVPQLNRLWSIVSKSLQEIVAMPVPEAACEVMLIRLCHVSDLPPLNQLIEQVQTQLQSGSSVASAQSSEPQPKLTPIHTFDQLVDWVNDQRDPHLSFFLKRDVRVHAFVPGRVECSLSDPSHSHLIKELKQLLQAKRDETWVFELVQSTVATAPLTMYEETQAKETSEKQEVFASEVVQEALKTFEGAKVSIEKLDA